MFFFINLSEIDLKFNIIYYYFVDCFINYKKNLKTHKKKNIYPFKNSH